ncbi:signal peptidase I [Enterococcus sp. 7E2_DIV0204]|uniref:Signal peptidase I n=2 Tax=Enterococcus TaxID=1350 RepID=A0ABZ2T8B4_9ENTE|nr:signal peptidase I [Enterococcus sp. 7E2_DIV0204]OTO70996.1 signal peptidase I [Enterococcus sp. 12C11_DIV0727]OTP51292.1 signal peptidase I [Enterococcus sp. 7D2_DIV0200]
MIPTFTEGDRILIDKGKTPKRYELVTLDPLKKPKESYIKRVIGIPNDTIKIDKNTLYLETEDNKIVTVTLDASVANELKGLEKIPKNNYFVMGDNRNHSNDSRSFGLVSIKQIEGVAFFRYYPLNRIGLIQ